MSPTKAAAPVEVAPGVLVRFADAAVVRVLPDADPLAPDDRPADDGPAGDVRP